MIRKWTPDPGRFSTKASTSITIGCDRSQNNLELGLTLKAPGKVWRRGQTGLFVLSSKGSGPKGVKLRSEITKNSV